MRTSTWLCTGAVLLSVVACGRGAPDPSAKVSADLEQDLTKASSSTLELANGAQSFQPTRVVSDIERTDRAIPIQRKKVPKPVVRDLTSSNEDQAKAPAPLPQDVVAQLEDPQPEAAAPAAANDDVPRVPMVAPRPAPIPVDVPAEDGSGSRGGRARGSDGPGPDIPTIIGIMIQGGGIGDDHCVPHTGRRPRGPGMRIPPPMH